MFDSFFKGAQKWQPIAIGAVIGVTVLAAGAVVLRKAATLLNQ
jgi:hypothetical protein